MANHFPANPGMQLANLQYQINMAPIAGSHNSSPEQTMRLVNFGFERADPGTGAITFDFSLFDQDNYEAGLRTMLTGICTSWAGNLGVPLAATQAGMTVTRVWTFGSADQLGGSSPVFTMTDTMTYP